MTDRAKWAETHLQHRFASTELLEQALTHRSASRENYERLEFLGDAFLNFAVASRLYELRPEYAEGELSRARASLVNKSTLAAIARELGIDRMTIVGPGEKRTGGAQRGSVIADTLEALIGAVYLDGGHAAAYDLIMRLYRDRIDSLPDPQALKDAKTRLQEWLQARSLPLPIYAVDAVTGKEHEKSFRVVCSLGDDSRSSVGSGRSRRLAEQAAAANLLAELLGE